MTYKPVTISFDELNERVVEAIRLLEDGLLADGVQHKQWYLDQVMRKLLGATGYDERIGDLLEEDYWWDGGIAP